MASESETEKRETLADIVAEIRAYGAQPPPRLMWLEIADRIEAAHKRESAEWKAAACACVSDAVMSGKVAVEHVPVGNAAAMREALNKVGNAAAWIAERCNDQQTAKYMNDIIAIVQTALAAPARQCDVGTPEEQAERHKAYCRKRFTPDQLGGNCRKCPLKDRRGWSCQLAWAQMPYEAKEGGAE